MGGAAGWTVSGLLALGLAWLAKAPLLHLFTKVRGERVLGHKARQDILERIQGNPGIRYRDLARHHPHGVLEHHLDVLEGAGLVVALRHAGRTSFFAKGSHGQALMVAVGTLHAAPAQEFVRSLRSAEAGPAALARRLGLSASTLHYHRQRLEQAGVVERTGRGRGVRLRLTELGAKALGIVTPDPVAG